MTAILDNSLVLKAYHDGKSVIFSKGFSRIEDEETYRKLRKVTETLLTPTN